MGWWSIGDDLLCGDQPLDVYGGALQKIAQRYRDQVKRLPQLLEMLAAFDASDTSGPSATHDALQAAIAAPAPSASKRPPPLRTGEILAIPYDGSRAVVGIVLFGEEIRGKGPGYGPCLVALDLETTALEGDVDRARTAPWLLRPFHPGSRMRAVRLGRVDLTPDASFLPCFAWYTYPGSSSRALDPSPGLERRIFDYFDVDVTGRPGVETRVVPPSIGGTIDLLVGIRAARGLNRTLPWSDVSLAPGADQTPLARLAPFRAAATPKPRAKKQAPLEPADEGVTSFAAGVLAEARRAIERAFGESVGRPATREEVAHAFALTLASSADELVVDPTRFEALPAPRAPRPATPVGAPTVFEVKSVYDRDLVMVRSGSTSWCVYPFREGGALVAETLFAPDDAVAHVREALAAWRFAFGLPAGAEPVLVRPMDRGVAVTIEG